MARRNFQLRPLQSADALDLLGLSEGDMLRESNLLLADGRTLGGADAVVEIARHIWWGWPLWLLSRAPGVRPVLHAIYRVIAANRHCLGGVCKIPRRRGEKPTRATEEKPKQSRASEPHHRHSAFLELP